MGYALKIWFIFSVFVALIVWAARPDMIEKAGKEISAPYKEYKTRTAAEAWKAAQDEEYLHWIASNPLPAKCNNPQTGLINVECMSLKQERDKTFNALWRSRINNGWKPAGIN